MAEQHLPAILLVTTAVANHLNQRFFKLPKAIGLTLITLVLSFALIGLLKLGQYWVFPLKAMLSQFNFSTTFMNGMLSFLLFAGALNINAVDLKKHITVILSLATASVFICSLLIALALWWVSALFHLGFNFYYCFLFGALISPTDAVSVMDVMKRSKVPSAIRARITGESLFNDAAGIFLFVIAFQLLAGQVEKLHVWHLVWLIIKQGFGGALLGYVVAQITIYLLKYCHKYEGAVIATMAAVTGGYTLATLLMVSGPIAMVIAGLLIGQYCRKPYMAYAATRGLYDYWNLIDEVFNAFLFVLIGLVILTLSVNFTAIVAGVIIFILLVLARGISVSIPILMVVPLRKVSGKMLAVMTWGGLRGGLSIALALSLPHYDNPIANTMITITYTVVVLSILLQGLSLQPMIDRLYPPNSLENTQPHLHHADSE